MGSVLIIIVVVLALVSYCHLLAEPLTSARARAAIRPAEASPAPGTTEGGQVTPEKDRPPPPSEMTPEERERLSRSTQRVDPKATDNSPPSPPGLPLTPGPETKVAPSPKPLR